MLPITHLTTISEESPSKQFITKYGGYMRSNGRVQKNVINTISFLSSCDCRDALLVIVVSDWKMCESSIILNMFPELCSIHVWTRDMKIKSTDERIVIRYNRPGQSSYADETRRILLVCSIVCKGDNFVMEEIEAQDRVLHNVNPDEASLKFRPPYNKKNRDVSKFYSGVVRTICYSQACSIETRIHVKKGSQLVNYNVTKYRDQLFHYNTEIRPTVIDGLSFDETYCLSILEEYLLSKGMSNSAMCLWADIVSMLI